MSRFFLIFLMAGLLVCAPLRATEYVHRPVGPGLLYPNTTSKMLKAIFELLEEAEGPSPKARLLACVAPHSALGLSGEVAAEAFKDLRPGQYDRVMVLAPAHYASFSGCSIAAVVSESEGL